VVESDRPPVLVIGVGNELRGDDGAGVEVARCLSARPEQERIEISAHQGDPVGLIDEWCGYEVAVIVDTMRSGAAPGTIRRLDASEQGLPGALRGSSSTHALGLCEAIELARIIRKLPPRVIVYAIEGRSFETGSELSEEVRARIPELASMVLHEARR
jgi:hydrogenase maturation protease